MGEHGATGRALSAADGGGERGVVPMDASAGEWLSTHVVASAPLHPASGLCLLTLAAAPRSRAGQHVRLRPADLAGPPRYYSLASAPAEPAQILVAPARDGGSFDPALLAAGDALQVSAEAAGRLVLDDARGRALWLFGAGTGIAPLRAMVRHGQGLAGFERVVVVHGARDHARLAFFAELSAAAAGSAGRMRYLTLLTGVHDAGDGADVSALPGRRGRIPAAIAADWLEGAAAAPLDASAVAVVCGPPAMVADTVAALQRLGLRLADESAGPGQIITEQ